MTNKIQVLDHGFVEHVETFGSDERIVRVARASTSGSVKRNSRGLIRYLVRHGHESPLEFCEITFKVKCPIFVARQIMRHRTANFSEQSGRYTDNFGDYYLPDVERMNPQKTKHLVAEDEKLINAEDCKEDIQNACQDSFAGYHWLKQTDLAKEVARVVLPLSTYTTFYFKIDLRNLLHYLELRLDEHTQWEHRQFANAISGFVKRDFPIVWSAFEDYKLNSITLTGPETNVLSHMLFMLDSGYKFSKEHMNEIGMSEGEIKEFYKKLDRIDNFWRRHNDE